MTQAQQQDYQVVYSELFDPAYQALGGIRLDSRQRHTVAGLLAEVAGRAAERLATAPVERKSR
jgi:hypothetical protein